MTKFRLEIIAPQRKAFDDTVDAVYVPTENGEIGVLAHHIPLFTTLTEGEIKIVSDRKEFFLAIGGGFMQVTPDGASILVSRAVHAEEINETEIKKALEAAKEAIKRKSEGAEMEEAQAILRRSMVEFKVLRHKQRRQSGPPVR
jgi:F-type H+-transporting ATPase subunit epsilon